MQDDFSASASTKALAQEPKRERLQQNNEHTNPQQQARDVMREARALCLTPMS